MPFRSDSFHSTSSPVDRPAPAPAPGRPRRGGLSQAGARGTILIVALLLMAVIALGITSYLNLSLGSARLASRSFQQAAAFNLAEAGAEEALWSFNRANARENDAWNGWTTGSGAARRTFDSFNFGANSTGNVKVSVDNFSLTGSTQPTVVALATVQATGQPPVSKMLEVTLRRRSRYTAGLMARLSVTFAGLHASVDSWNSDPDNDPSTPPVDYSSATRNDRGSVASVAVDNTAVLVNQASVWGYVYTGGAAPNVGTNGSITGRNTPFGVQIDPTRVATDFTADFPAVSAPTDGTPLATLGATLGTMGQTTKWRTNSITLSGKQTLTILGDVTLVLTAGPGAAAIAVTGQASIIIPNGSSLKVYTEGDVLIAGNGLTNLNVRPGTFQLFGTNTSAAGQAIQIAGNGALRAVGYAPEGDIKLNGNGDVMGAFVGRTITLTGNADFHYDESLAQITDDMPFGVQSWRELTTASERQAKASRFAGW
jgi:Tfp pilus assembly protein PilX